MPPAGSCVLCPRSLDKAPYPEASPLRCPPSALYWQDSWQSTVGLEQLRPTEIQRRSQTSCKIPSSHTQEVKEPGRITFSKGFM